MSSSETETLQLERDAYDRFVKEWYDGGFKGLRFGQAFYNYFFLHKLSDQTGLDKLYNGVDTDKSMVIILDKFTFH